MKSAPVVVIRTQPETVHEDARRALRLCASRRAPARAGACVVIDRGQVSGTATPAWALRAIVEDRRAAHVDPSHLRVATLEPDPGRSVEPSLDRTLAALELRVESIAREGDHAVDVELPWLRGRRGGDVRVDAGLAGRDLWWAGSLRLDARLGWRGAVDGALSLVGRPDERADADPQTLLELSRLLDATVAGKVFLLDATICTSADGKARPQVHNLILAGRDPLAIDAVAGRVLGFDPERVAWLRALAEVLPREITPGAIPLRGGAFEAGEAVARNDFGGRAVPARRRSSGRRAALDPRRLLAGWNRRRWDRLYARTPWGRLREHERRDGRATGEERG